MKLLILTLISFTSLNCLAQILEKSDTLIIKERITLLLDNSGFAIPPFAVSGTLYFTNYQMIFHPKPFRRKRVEMYNDLIKDIIIPYDSISVVKKASIDGLKIKTKTRKYKFAGWRIKPRAIITLINRLKKERAIR